MKKIAITGSSGLVGSRILELLQNDFEFIELKQDFFEITNKDSVHKTLKDIDFDLLLHLAAYTNVDLAEKEKELAHQINVEGTKNIAEIVSVLNKQLIYISTDFVFDGTHPPYTENSQPNPLGYYGQTKYEGEQVVKDMAMIVRFSYPYRAQFEGKKDFIRTIISLLKEKKPINMVNDSLITPTFIDDIAFCLKYLFNNYSVDLYHLVGADSMSPYQAGQLIAKTFKLDESLIRPTTYLEYFKNKALRPQYSEMKSLKNNFHQMLTLEEGLKACYTIV